MRIVFVSYLFSTNKKKLKADKNVLCISKIVCDIGRLKLLLRQLKKFNSYLINGIYINRLYGSILIDNNYIQQRTVACYDSAAIQKGFL